MPAAKLSDHGYEVARLMFAVNLSGDDHVEREEVHQSFRSTGAVLVKRVVTHRLPRPRPERAPLRDITRWQLSNRLGWRTYAGIARYAATVFDRGRANGLEAQFSLKPRQEA